MVWTGKPRPEEAELIRRSVDTSPLGLALPSFPRDLEHYWKLYRHADPLGPQVAELESTIKQCPRVFRCTAKLQKHRAAEPHWKEVAILVFLVSVDYHHHQGSWLRRTPAERLPCLS